MTPLGFLLLAAGSLAVAAAVLGLMWRDSRRVADPVPGLRNRGII